MEIDPKTERKLEIVMISIWLIFIVVLIGLVWSFFLGPLYHAEQEQAKIAIKGKVFNPSERR